MTINRDRIVFIDLETTGLIPEEGSPSSSKTSTSDYRHSGSAIGGMH